MARWDAARWDGAAWLSIRRVVIQINDRPARPLGDAFAFERKEDQGFGEPDMA